RRVPAPFEEKLIAGIVAIALIALLAYVLWVVARCLWVEGGWRTRAGGWLLARVTVPFVTTLLDRAPAAPAEGFAVTIAPLVKRDSSAFEEGLEAALPLVLAFSAWISRGERRYL